ncbi:Por secretion system C-terminal sorting domain-containing protein [Hymenobacter daecheongensis DSM 21074]|uniref:Por secretion system C-terminal sorting domain-containing protein n=1 Tax=Hymenobacter daecheongensis DSM 21074 TaxID=1121955 RepID=A0A1M6G7X1_9BACT|nr:Calx-beta domain-containing protein [Hymenobacter daecheongensis]SHJ06070.1 Por secretion system C-terminal sorting domain-containing protein [Hymenobacter daecheongensis DSM 21074]
MSKSYATPLLRRLAVALGLGLSATVAQAQAPLATYSFANAAGNEVTFPVDAQPANATFSPMARGAGVTASAGAGTFAATDWSMAALDATDYFSFSVQPGAGFKMRLDSVVLDERRSNTGIITWALRSSLDNFAANLATVTVPDNPDTRVNKRIDLPPAFGNVTTPVEFRLYGYNAEAATGSWRIDNVRTFGVVSAATGGSTPTVAFGAASGSVLENAGTATVPVTISNSSAQAISVDVVLATPAGTATSPADYTYTTQTVTFPANSTTTRNVTVTIADDAVAEADETVILKLQNVLPAGSATASTGTYTLTIQDNDTPNNPTISTIAAVTVNDATGVPTRLGTAVTVRGTIYGTNLRTAGYQMSIIDPTGGVGIFASANIGTPAIVLTEGDSVQVTGTVSQFNGLTQLTLTSITPAGTARRMYQPRLLTGPLTENDESELVRVAGPLTSVDPTQWTTTSTAAGYNVDVRTAAGTTYQLRINRGTTAYNMPAPTGPFSATGLGGQFDGTTPFTEGYQLVVRRASDIAVVTAAHEPAFAQGISLYPNPAATTLTLRVGAEGRGASIEIMNMLGQRVQQLTATQETVALNVASLKAGVYAVRFTTKAGSVTRAFVKK